MKQKIYSLFIAFAISIGTLYASDIQVKGIWYDFDGSTKTASVTYRGSSSGSYFGEYSGSVTIPSSVTYNNVTYSVTSIGNSAFSGCSGLRSVTIPNSVTSIGSSAFYNCSGLTEVHINDIAAWCNISFSNYYSNPLNCAKHLYLNNSEITNLVVPDSVTSIGSYAFYNCSGLTSVTIGNSVTSIGSTAFYGCSGLTSVTIGNSVTSIGSSAFYNCSGLTSVTIPNSVTSIGSSAFYNCSRLTSIEIPNSVTSIGEMAFSYCSGLKNIDIPNSVTRIGTGAFSSCSGLTSVTIGNSVTSIGNSAFFGCSGLTSVTIGNSVTSIGNSAFYGCSGLTSVTIPNSVSSIESSAFSKCSGLVAIYVPCGEIQRFKQLIPEYSTIIQYAPLTHEVDGKANNASWGSVSVPLWATCDTIISASAKYGYHFEQWSDGVADNPRTIELTQDTTFTAEFAKNEYTITTECANPEWGTTEGATALYLDTIQISAIPNYGYHFTHWNDGNTSNPRTITVTADKTYTAIFAKNIYGISAQCDSEQGTISGPSQAEYLDIITLTANPKYGYHFVQWSDGIADNPRTIELTQDTSFTAEFAKNTYSITTSSDNIDWGVTDGDGTALYQDQLEISAMPNYGYHFVHWNDNNTSNPRAITVTEDRTYTATFAKNIYTITDNSIAVQGSIDGLSQAEYLDSVALEAVPNYGYHFVQWSDSVTDNPRTIVLTQDTTFTAEFAISRTGTCGNDNLLTWTYEPDSKRLIIRGEGALNENYTYGLEAPSSMKKLVLSNGITSVGSSAFKNSKRLEAITLGAGIEAIGDSAFADCLYILSVYSYMEYPPAINASVFDGDGDLSMVDLYVPEDSYALYRKMNVWKEFNLQNMPTPTAIDPVPGPSSPITQKIFREGQILILRGERVYTLQGQLVNQ